MFRLIDQTRKLSKRKEFTVKKVKLTTIITSVLVALGLLLGLLPGSLPTASADMGVYYYTNNDKDKRTAQDIHIKFDKTFTAEQVTVHIPFPISGKSVTTRNGKTTLHLKDGTVAHGETVGLTIEFSGTAGTVVGNPRWTFNNTSPQHWGMDQNVQLAEALIPQAVMAAKNDKLRERLKALGPRPLGDLDVLMEKNADREISELARLAKESRDPAADLIAKAAALLKEIIVEAPLGATKDPDAASSPREVLIILMVEPGSDTTTLFGGDKPLPVKDSPVNAGPVAAAGLKPAPTVAPRPREKNIGDLIAEVMEKVGKDGVITVTESRITYQDRLPIRIIVITKRISSQAEQRPGSMVIYDRITQADKSPARVQPFMPAPPAPMAKDPPKASGPVKNPQVKVQPAASPGAKPAPAAAPPAKPSQPAAKPGAQPATSPGAKPAPAVAPPVKAAQPAAIPGVKPAPAAAPPASPKNISAALHFEHLGPLPPQYIRPAGSIFQLDPGSNSGSSLTPNNVLFPPVGSLFQLTPVDGRLINSNDGKVYGSAILRLSPDKIQSTIKFETEYVEGMKFDRSYISPYFVANAERRLPSLTTAGSVKDPPVRPPPVLGDIEAWIFMGFLHGRPLIFKVLIPHVWHPL